MTRSKYFLLFCVAFIFGIFFGSYLSISIWILFLEAGFFISLVFLLWDNKKVRIILLLAIFILFGFIRIESGKLSENKIFEIESLNNQKILLEGIISEMPETKNGKQKIIIYDIKNKKDNSKINGKMIVYADMYPEYNLGNIIEASGKIKTPEDFDGFKYRDYLFSKGIYYIVYYPEIKLINNNADTLLCHPKFISGSSNCSGQILNLQAGGKNNREQSLYLFAIFKISQFRTYANNIIKKIFPQPQAGIVSAMTLAIKSDLGEETLEIFNKTGTRHIIAISGLHMTIVCFVLMYVLLAIGLNRNHAFYFAFLGIIFFVMLVGFPPSAVRAAVVSGLALFAIKVGRLKSAGNAIVFAGVLMLLYDPNLLRYDTGFQLSFAAVFGIIYIFPQLNKFFEKYKDFLNIRTIFLITISAQIATFPIIINSFGNFSLLSVFANVLILPFAPIVMLGGFLVAMIGFVNLFTAQILSWPIWLVLSYQIEIIKFFAGFDLGYFSFEKVGIWFIAIYYGVLILWLNYSNIIKCQKNI